MIRKNRDLNVLLICKSGRLDALRTALARSPRVTGIYILSEVDNPGIHAPKTVDVRVGKTDSPQLVAAYAAEVQPDLVVIGPEEPLAAGVVDILEGMDIPCVGPRRALARIEWSKAYARKLLATHAPELNPRFGVFDSLAGIREYLHSLEQFVIKPDGLTGGKGVKVFGDHLFSVQDGVEYCEEILAQGHQQVVIEEHLDGEEFSLQSFCDGTNVVHTMPIQDHKRVFNDDQGPNTGGMGSYSCENFLLPFLTPNELREAEKANEKVCHALAGANGLYKGVLYGGFIVTKNGIRVIEYNSRFGDPEIMNVMPLLETDFADICIAIVNGTLSPDLVRFKRLATVCKYVVPQGYPTEKRAGTIRKNSIASATDKLHVYYAAIQDGGNDNLILTGSRALAFVGVGPSVEEAEQVAEAAATQVVGDVHHRTDIGTRALLQRRVVHMESIRRSTNSGSRAAA